MSPKNRGSGTALLLLLLAAGLAVAGVTASGPVLRPARPVPHYHWAPTDLVAEPCYNTDCPDEAAWAPSAPLGDPDGVWVSVPPPTTEPNRMCSANCYDQANDLLYMIGGDPAGYYGVANCQRFNPVTNTWTNLANMGTACTWLDGEGAFVQRLGKIYICGGYTGSALATVQEYTVANNTWTNRASMPSATLAYQSGIWRDSLIYICGGTGPSLSGSAVVQIYNPFSNTWTTGTSMPEAGDMGSGTILGDTIYITNSYNRTGGTLWTNARKGAINPSNPTSITWSTWTGVQTLGFNGGTTRLVGKIYRLGGFASLSGGPHKRGWVYNPANGAVDTLPWLPSPPTTGVARCNFLNRREAGNELFKFAGDDEGNWSTPNNTYYRNQFTPPYDVGVTAILQPAGGRLTPGTAIVPTIVIGNLGLNAVVDVPVYFVVDSIDGTNVYSEVTLVSLPVNAVDTVEFPDWTPNCVLWGGYRIRAITALVGDAIPTNDTLKMVGLYTQDEIYCNPGASGPTIDGFMAPNEWSDAYPANISNGLGRGMTGNNPFGPNAAWVYFKNDASYLYIACAMPEWANRAIGDQFGIYLDENNNDQWETSPVEGNYWIWVNGSNADEVLYRPWTYPYNAGTPGAAPGSLSASTWYNGYLVIECRLPIGTLPYQLNINPANDTLGMFIYAQGNNKLYGWWPIDLAADTGWNRPACYGSLIIRTQQSGNVRMAQIVRPTGSSVRVGDTLVPAGRWENTGTTSMNFTAYYFLDSAGTRVYSQSQSATLAGGANVTLEFPAYTFQSTESQNWVAKCSTAAAGDQIAGDNVQTRAFNVTAAPPWPEGWAEVASLPGPAKDGGWLTGNASDGKVYGGRGYKSLDFYAYDPSADIWTSLAGIPAGAKPTSKGTNGVSDGVNTIYCYKGNKTYEFYAYDITTNTWTQLADVPGGTSGKPGKNSDLAYYGGFVYLLKGNKSDFARFNVATQTWEALADAPAGSKAKWDKGSWLVSDGNGLIYAHKSKYHEMFAFDVATQTWGTALSGMPFMGQLGKNKKSKDGGSAAFYGGAIYALKGGNTVEFWKYVTGTATWTELALMPEIGSTGKKKRVKAGGDLAGWSGGPAFFALKGNKTTEFWRYVEPAGPLAAQPERGGVAAQPVALNGYGFALSPNPVSRGLATLSYSVPSAGAARVTVLDVTGRDVMTRTLTANRTGTTSLDLTGLSAGVYLVKLESPNYTAATKLIVQ